MIRFEPYQKIIYGGADMVYKVERGDRVKLKEKKFKKPLFKSRFFLRKF